MKKYSILALVVALHAGGGPSKMTKEGYKKAQTNVDTVDTASSSANPPAYPEAEIPRQLSYRKLAHEINELNVMVGAYRLISDQRVSELTQLFTGIAQGKGHSFIMAGPYTDGAAIGNLAAIVKYGHHLPPNLMNELLGELKAHPKARGHIAFAWSRNYPDDLRPISAQAVNETLRLCNERRARVSESESLQLFEAELRRTADKVVGQAALIAAQLGLEPKR